MESVNNWDNLLTSTVYCECENDLYCAKLAQIIKSLENDNINAIRDGNGAILSYANKMNSIECGNKAPITLYYDNNACVICDSDGSIISYINEMNGIQCGVETTNTLYYDKNNIIAYGI